MPDPDSKPGPPTRGPELGSPSSPGRSLRRYIVLQCLSLAFCWGWFAALWTIAFFDYDMGNIEWWVLVIGACAGLYGLRPNLERAIDTAWLKGITNNKVLAERVAELRPIKRRIDLIFSVVMVVGIMVLFFFWIAGFLSVPPSGQSG